MFYCIKRRRDALPGLIEDEEEKIRVEAKNDNPPPE